jgi:putative heme iron utilization protein
MTDTAAARPYDPHRDGSMDPQPGVARPSHAERVRTLVHGAGSALLSTIARDPAGYPFGSLVTFLVDGDGSPWVLVSTMAEHTRNAQNDRRASLLVTEQAPTGVDPLALGRVSLVGDLMSQTPTPDLRAAFLERHPGARFYVDFPDFGWWKLDVHAVRYVGGFGRMSWVEPAEYAVAAPDPIAPFADGIVTHMNADHADSHVVLIHHVVGRTDVTSAVMTGVDRLGCDLDAQSPRGTLPLRLPFPAPVTSAEKVRATLVSMLREARAAMAGG